MKHMQPQEYAIKVASKNRGLEYNPINFYKEGTQFHHMFLNGDSGIGIFIPTELHCGVGHDRFNESGMKKMNKTALLWLCEQSQIAPEYYSQKYTDCQFLDAVRICLKKTTVSSAEVAKELGCNRFHAKLRMQKIVKQGKLVQEFKNTAWEFKFPDHEKLHFEVKNESGELIKICQEGIPFELKGLKIIISRITDPEN